VRSGYVGEGRTEEPTTPRVIPREWVIRAGAALGLMIMILAGSWAGGPVAVAQDPSAAPSGSARGDLQTAPPTSAGSPSHSPTASLAVLDAALAAHVPASIAQVCEAGPSDYFEGSTASLICTLDDGITADYVAFPDDGSMGWAFQLSLVDVNIGSGGATCREGPYIGPYTRDGVAAGQVACWDAGTLRGIMWTNDALRILVVASAGLDLADLYAWWLEAGPLP
jgi:hypothetical protein